MEQVNKVAYTIAATAKGGRGGRTTSEDGSVDVELGKPGSKKANPETLFAAGYAACFNGALNMVASQEDVDTTESQVTADVTFGETDSGFGLAVDIVALIPGVDDAQAQELVEKAHQACPYSKATRGNIEVTVSGKAA
ncbi:Ohr family peroxiredoxin [Ornithinimicrobium sp. INDO-MA30-4]|uniref:Ohr family peroxiredoxin n=1 Tax=Ornithinimicrobium sp. INDO-MA30-4 TaxID=2908651 RepID=UPI001F36E06D|nr:Ohr family peroxiredoxin [Ornithinimicrobium sp. INDO-MA30-4]UJH69417.1 Ohr family peroxiredoxin [Ornithinimicrobium sp. INDO-MA30-4]